MLRKSVESARKNSQGEIIAKNGEE